MTQKVFCLDLGRCIGCSACTIACKEFRGLNPSTHRRVVRKMDDELTSVARRNYISSGCNHCDEPMCLAKCPAQAYSKNEMGIVVHDKDVCLGCKMCAWACPYNVPAFDDVAGVMDKCDMCYERLQAGEEPYCVASCPMDVIKVYDIDNIPDGYIYELTGYPDVKLTKPNVRFKMHSGSSQIRRS